MAVHIYTQTIHRTIKTTIHILGRPRHKWEDNIKMGLKDIVHDSGTDLINTGFIDIWEFLG